MAITQAWDATDPADGNNPTQGALEIRDLKAALFERFEQGLGMKWPDATEADSGRLTCGIQGTTGVIDLVYEEDGDLLLTLHDDTAGADASRMILGTGRGGARDYTFETEYVEAARVDISEYLKLTGIESKAFADSPYDVGTEGMLIYSTTGGNSVINLPAATEVGRVLMIHHYGGGVSRNITVNADGTDDITYRSSFHGASSTTALIVMGDNLASIKSTNAMLVVTSSGHWHALFYYGV